MEQIFVMTRKVAAYHQRELDRHGVLYFSEQGYDDFYPGKGSTYPDLHGTVGILFEQASARGLAQENENGLLTFPFAIRNQVYTSFSSLEAAIGLRQELLELQREFVKDTAQLAAQDKVRAYVFGDDGDPARAWAFLDLLHRQRIEVRPLKTELQASGQTFTPGSAWVALTNQAQYRLLHEMFVQRTVFEDNIFYDVSAWTLPLAFNLPFAELDSVPATGDVLADSPVFPAGALIGGHSDYAYLIDWSGYYAPRALRRLQQAGIVVKGLTDAPIEIVAADGTRAKLAPGAVLVPVGIQPDKAGEISAIIDLMVREDAVKVYGCGTGLTPAGVDFGSKSFVNLELPKIALIVGQGVDAQEIGAAWHVLDQRLGLTPTLLDLAQLGKADLARYNVIMFADGLYTAAVSDKSVAALKEWVHDGGTLVLTGKATEWAAKQGLAALEFASTKPEADKKAAKNEATKAESVGRQPYGTGWDREALNLVRGVVLDASIDTTHPLGFGFNGDHVAFCRTNLLLLKPAKSPYETPAVYTTKPLRSGYASEANQELIANSAAVVALTNGKGVVVAMPDDPNFRGFWYGGNRVFFNALFYGRAIKTIRSSDGAEAATQ